MKKKKRRIDGEEKPEPALPQARWAPRPPRPRWRADEFGLRRCVNDRRTTAAIPLIFFFSSRRRHTRSTRDWSSDVCSSDLAHPTGVADLFGLRLAVLHEF